MKSILMIVALLFATISTHAQKTVIHCGSLIDGISDSPQKEMTIIVEGGKITTVQKGLTKPGKDDKLVDLTSMTVMPGFIDMHVHIEGETSPTRYSEGFRMNEADYALRATTYASKTLMAGFTMVRDCGGSGVNVSLRKAIAAGYIDGPRIYTAGKAIGTTGGHADPTNGLRKDLMGDPGPKEGVINSPEEARKAVRQRYKDGADFIKITATGGVLSVAKDGSGPQFTQEEVDEIVRTANEYGMITAAHAHGAEGMMRAVKAGITTIEHGTMMTSEVMEEMKKQGTYFVPTISAGKYVAEKAKIEGYYPALVTPKALAIGPQIQNTFKKAYEAGVNIAFGTDAGVFPHGENAKEFGYMVEVGMDPMEAIMAATSVNARVLKMEDKVGSIRKDLFADIVAVEGDPIKDISVLENVNFVMKEGEIYKND